LSWCNKLASVPGAGFGLDAHFASGEAILNAISPITDKLFDDPKILFNITHHTSFEIRFSTLDGFNYSLEPSKLSVEFVHRMRPRVVSGGAPIMEMLSRPLPYADLLPVVMRKLIEVALIVPNARTRNVTRIGVISHTAVAEEEAPPGVIRFIEYMGRPWRGLLETFSMQISSEVGKGPGYRDRCHHTIVRSEDKDALLAVTLDFQRLYTASIPLQMTPLKEASDRVEKAALKYFEDVGEGRRFDEDIITETAGV
jgi:hypothetical protein